MLKLLRRPTAGSDDGFTLMEVLVAVVLMALVMVSVAALFFHGVSSSANLQRHDSASAVADQAMEVVRSVPPALDPNGTSHLLYGRTKALMDPMWSGAAAAGVDVTQTQEAYDSTSGTPTPTVPISVLRTVSGQNYTVATYIGKCWKVSPSTTCTAPASPPATGFFYRAIVAVSWNLGGGKTCGGHACIYTVSTLINPDSDPSFNNNRRYLPTPPVAVDDTFPVAFNTMTPLPILANDTYLLLSTTKTPPITASSPAHGTLAWDGIKQVMNYTPATNYFGPDSFTYTITDNADQVSNPATVTIAVSKPAMPTARPDAATLTTLAPAQIPVLNNDLPSPSYWAQNPVRITSQGTKGTATADAAGVVTYTPAAGVTGQDSFTYSATDIASQVSNITTVTITLPALIGPTANPDDFSSVKVCEGGSVTKNVVTNDLVTPPVSVVSVTQPGTGRASVGASAGSVTYTAAKNTGSNKGYGTFTFQYTIQDASGLTSSATVTFKVSCG